MTYLSYLSDEMEKGPSLTALHRFTGYFSALVCSIYGHRPGVLTNMTVNEVVRARTVGDSVQGDGYIISVDNHKTSRKFGAAQFFLTDTEFSWLERWLQLRQLWKPTTSLVLITHDGRGPVKNLVRHMQEVWGEMRLPGRPTFTDIRTAVSGHVKIHHQSEVRDELARLMCHSTETANKYYSHHLEKSYLRGLRGLFDAVLASSTTRLGGGCTQELRVELTRCDVDAGC